MKIWFHEYGITPSLRSIFYRLISLGIIPNTENFYKRLSSVTVIIYYDNGINSN